MEWEGRCWMVDGIVGVYHSRRDSSFGGIITIEFLVIIIILTTGAFLTNATSSCSVLTTKESYDIITSKIHLLQTICRTQ